MEKEDKNYSIKVERHVWPDEIEKTRKKRNIIYIVVASVLVSFLLGWQFSNLTKGTGIISSPNTDVARFERVYNELLSNWYFANEMEDAPNELITNAIKGMLEMNGDIHTSYMTQEELAGFTTSINMDFVGIGVQYFPGDGANVITRVFKDSPAEKYGVEVGDVIYRVEGELLTGLTSDQIQSLIIGEEGTVVNIDFLRQEETVSLAIPRGAISAVVWGEMLDDDIAYLEISSFGQTLAASTQLYLDDFKAQGAKKLIIDMRDNGGGYLQAINDIAALFFENNDVVYQEEFKDGTNKVYNVTSSQKSNYDFEDMIVLVNENSASASEVLTMALRENLGTRVLGVNSYGKGTVQTQSVFGDQSSLKITIAKWMSPNGNNIHEVGIEPDIEVKLHDIFYSLYPTLEDGTVLQYDSVDESISYVQQGLNYLGLYTGRTDGYYDDATLAALRSFQNSDDITQTTIQNVYSAVVSDWSQNRATRDVQLIKAIEVLNDES